MPSNNPNRLVAGPSTLNPDDVFDFGFEPLVTESGRQVDDGDWFALDLDDDSYFTRPTHEASVWDDEVQPEVLVDARPASEPIESPFYVCHDCLEAPFQPHTFAHTRFEVLGVDGGAR